MGGFFGTIQVKDCVNDLFYGTDYNSHLGTKRAGLVTFDKEHGFARSIHSLERDYFRSRFEGELDKFVGNSGLGVISDTDPQPILVNSHLGRYAVVTVAKINNLRDIAQELLDQRMHFSEMSANNINPTELVALLINMGKNFVEGINLEDVAGAAADTPAAQGAGQAIAALVSLGYSQSEAALAVSKIDGTLPVEEIIKLALRGMAGRR